MIDIKFCPFCGRKLEEAEGHKAEILARSKTAYENGRNESKKLDIKEAAKIIKEHCSARGSYGCGGCELHDEENPDRICRVNAFPVYWKI